jgi:hypothetical protein
MLDREPGATREGGRGWRSGQGPQISWDFPLPPHLVGRTPGGEREVMDADAHLVGIREDGVARSPHARPVALYPGPYFY